MKLKNQEGVPVLLIQVIHKVPQNGCIQTKQAHRHSPRPMLLSVLVVIQVIVGNFVPASQKQTTWYLRSSFEAFEPDIIKQEQNASADCKSS
uniref:Uncharacterized protein n=1 Tax=Helianthus annuus TaxID=4232 RepID=A0A251UCZ3_HELAN